MKNKWTKWLALVLVLALTVLSPFTAGALHMVGDVNGDGKITVFDAQLLMEQAAGLRTLEVAEGITVQSILDYVLGDTTIDAGDLDSDGVIEIYTAEGLQLLHQQKNADFILMNDIDLQGAAWTPVVGYNGNFNGNGKTISNVNITESVFSGLSGTGQKFNAGFFGDTLGAAVITDLHLRNVSVTATEETLYMGLLMGSSRAQITGCTATGKIIDTRSTHSSTSGQITFIGALVGRICDPSGNDPVGNVAGGTTLTVTDELGLYETAGLCADVQFLISNRENINKGAKLGVVGVKHNKSVVSGIFRDSSYSSDLLSEAVQERQDIVVDYMNAMGTVAWTPSEQLVYESNPDSVSNSSRTYKPGTTYYGLPYNHHSGSMDRFLFAMDGQNAEGVYVTKTGLGDSIYAVKENGVGGYEGFVQLMGNDCSTAVQWAWSQISPTRVNPTTETYAGGVWAHRVRYMVPNESNQKSHGVYPVGSWTSSTYDATTNTWTGVEYDPSLAAYDITTERSSEEVLEKIGNDGMWEAYAQTHKADALARLRADANLDENGEPVLNASGNPTYSYFGHCRMVAADPVVIRNADGTIDGDLSYLITTEQGSSTGKTSTWKVNYRRSFATTASYDAANPYTSNGPYIPLTIRALRDEAVKAPYITKYYNMESPAVGKFYSNYYFEKISMRVTDAAGKVYYEDEGFTGVAYADGSARDVNFTTASLENLHADKFYKAAAENGMVEGKTYYYQAIATLSDGTQVNLNQKFLKEDISTFVYTPESA